MVALRGSQVASFIAKPDPKIRMILVYGPDAGLVAERGQQLAKAFAARETPPGEILRLDDADLDGDPDKLGVELFTVPMFGGAQIIRAAAGRRVNPAVRALLGGSAPAGALIVEAGELRRDDSLRQAFEKAGDAAAIACYPDEGGALDTLVSEVLGAAHMKIANDARQELLARLGADRVLSRAEVEKLVLYAHGHETITLEDVEAIIGDAADLTLDLVVTAAANGNVPVALRECDRAVAAGENPQTIMLAAERYFHRLHRLRVGLDAGRSLDDLLRQMRPPMPVKARAALERHGRAWTTPNATAAMTRIVDAIKASRTTEAEPVVLVERMLVEIARLARASAAARR